MPKLKLVLKCKSIIINLRQKVIFYGTFTLTALKIYLKPPAITYVEFYEKGLTKTKDGSMSNYECRLLVVVSVRPFPRLYRFLICAQFSHLLIIVDNLHSNLLSRFSKKN